MMALLNSGGTDESHTPLLSPSTERNVGAETPELGSAETASLSPSLRFLFGLGAGTLMLPSVALLYIVNTRASIPLPLLSAYGALAFLPSSLKPLYAFTSRHVRRDRLLSSLLALSGLIVASTALIPNGGVVFCFLLAFLRGVAIAWPEFLLDLTLIDQARRFERSSSFEEVAAVFQSQAATSRNIGSLVANAITFCIFLRQQHVATSDAMMNDTVVTLLFVLAGALSFVGAVVAACLKVGLMDELEPEPEHYSTLQDEERLSPCHITQDQVLQLHTECDDLVSSNACSDEDSQYSFTVPTVTTHEMSLGNDVMLVVLFQITIIMFAVRGPIVIFVGVITWSVVMALLVLALLVSAFCMKWEASHRMGAYLILRHAVPKTAFLMQSFIYWLFESAPVFLQILSLVNMAATTLASCSFGRLFAKFSIGWHMFALITATTVLASLLSLSNIIITRYDEHDQPGCVMFLTVVLVSTVTTFINEWHFLPSVILATTSVSTGTPRSWTSKLGGTHEHLSHSVGGAKSKTCIGDVGQDLSIQRDQDTAGVSYGTFVSCIDFGDQIGSWLTMPLVSALSISRETNWKNLDVVIVLASAGSLVSLLFLFVLGPPKV